MSRACKLCTKSIADTHEGVCDTCERDVCAECQPQGNTCRECVDESQAQHAAALAQSDEWAGLTDQQRQARINEAIRLT